MGYSQNSSFGFGSNGSSTGTVVDSADNGLSLSGSTVVLGQNVGQVGDPAILLNSREIPMGGFTLTIGTVASPGNFAANGGFSITSNTAGQQIFGGTWTATADLQYNTLFGGSFTSEDVGGETLIGYQFAPTLNVNVAGPATQNLVAVKIDPTFTGTASKYALELTADMKMNASDGVIHWGGTRLGVGSGGSVFFFRNGNGYGIDLTSNSISLNSEGSISMGSQNTATNVFFIGRQDVSPTTARTFALLRGMTPSGATMFDPAAGTAVFIEIGSASTAGNGFATFQPTSGNATYTSLFVNDYVSQTASATGAVQMLALTMSGNILGTLYGLTVSNTDAKSGFGTVTPTAKVHIGAGAATAGLAPLKFTTGTNLGTAEVGAWEFSSPVLFFTPTGTDRRPVSLAGWNNQTGTSYVVLAADQGKIIGLSNVAARGVTLCAANAIPAGVPIWFVDEAGTALTANITITRAGADTINGATTYVMNVNFQSSALYSDGVSKWFILSTL